MENLIKVLESTKAVQRQPRVYLILREALILCDEEDNQLSDIYAVISQKKYGVTMSASYFYSLANRRNSYLPASPKAVSIHSFDTAVALNAAYNSSRTIDEVILDIKYDLINMIRLNYSVDALVESINFFSPVKITVDDIHRHLETKLSKSQQLIICNITCKRLVAATPFQPLSLLKVPTIVRHPTKKYHGYGTPFVKQAIDS